jgi:hypothetical protein
MLMAIRTFGVLAALLLSTAGCYVDDLQERAPSTADADRNGYDCRLTLSTGSFDGHILTETEFSIEGKTFFNADDLAVPTRFAELVTIKKDGVALKAGTDFDVVLVSQLGRDNFADDFEYFLNGEGTRSGAVRGDGNFSVNELREGLYDLRVQKAIRFRIVEKATVAATAEPEAPAADEAPAVEPAEPAEPTAGGDTTEPAATEPAVTEDASTQPSPAQPAAVPAAQPEGKEFCATIYANTQLDVRRNKRAFVSFGDYKMYVTDNECGEAGEGTALTL